MTVNKILISIASVIALILIAAGAFWFWLNYAPAQNAPETGDSLEHNTEPITMVPEPLTGNSPISDLADFVAGAMDAEGKFLLSYRCEAQNCEPVPSTEATAFGYSLLGLIAGADAGNDIELRRQADLAITRALRLCGQDANSCLSNFFALEEYYERTNASSYKQALEKAGQLLLTTNASRLDAVVGALMFYPYKKMESLYKITDDESYLELLTVAADTALNNWPDRIEGTAIYETAAGQKVNYNHLLIASTLFIPAYRATNDEKYLRAAADLFKRSELEQHALGLRSERGVTLLLNSIEGLLDLSKIETLSQADRDAFRSSAALIMKDLFGWQYDAADRAIGDGTGGLLTGVSDATEPAGVNYKNINLNGWFAYLLADPSMADIDLVIYKAPTGF